MATQGTYYLDAPSLSSATIIYSDAALTTVAPDGFYSDGVISREQASGVLLPQVTCPSCANTEIYFDSLLGDVVTLGVNAYDGQTFSINFDYEIFALCDNEGTSGSDPNSATTSLYISTDGGSTYSSIASVSANVTGGNIPDPQFDSVSQAGTHTITGITDLSLVKLYATIDCDTGLNGKDGNATVILSSVSPTATIICNNRYIKACLSTTLDCTII